MKIYYNSKKKHSIYIMKVLIIILILLICFIFIKSNYESFKVYDPDYIEPTTDEYQYIIRLLTQNGLLDKTIITKLDEYKKLKETLEKKQINEINEDIETLKNRYNKTKIQLENILFNKFRPNRLNFNDNQQAFKLKLNSFIDDLKGEKIKITNYGSIDTAQCGNNWKLPDNVPPINNKEKNNTDNTNITYSYFNPYTKCCKDNISKDSCISQYKKNVKLYNEYKVVLKNQNNKKLELNKIKDNIYIVNLNSKIINYDKYTNRYDIIPILGTFEDIIISNISVCFKLVEIKDLIHLNQFITKDPLEDKLIDYPLYLIIPYEINNKAITIHERTNIDGEKLSIQPLSKEMINAQIFYKN